MPLIWIYWYIDSFTNYIYFSRDEDMQSMASLMSVNNNSDIAPLDDFDNEDIPEDVEEVSVKNLDEILDISAQLDLMTSSLTESELPSTPISGEYWFLLLIENASNIKFVIAFLILTCFINFIII